jgi:uncharacterized protein
MLLLTDFKRLSLEDKPVFDKIYKKYPPVHSDYIFTTLISWIDYTDYHYAILDENLILFSKIQGTMRFRPPIGEKKKEVFDKVLNLAKEQDSGCPFGMITSDVKDWMQKEYPTLNFKEHRGFFDYVYLASDLAELSGSDYSKIRNRLNKFKKTYEYGVENISKKNFEQIKDFLRRWCLWRDCESDPLLDNERKAILFSMDNFFELGLSGLAIIINDKIEAISVFEKYNSDTAVVHYEKGSPDYDGIYKAINQETAKVLQKNVKFINRESDMNISGLRTAKMSYRPCSMVKVFHLCKEDIVF